MDTVDTKIEPHPEAKPEVCPEVCDFKMPDPERETMLLLITAFCIGASTGILLSYAFSRKGAE